MMISKKMIVRWIKILKSNIQMTKNKIQNNMMKKLSSQMIRNNIVKSKIANQLNKLLFKNPKLHNTIFLLIQRNLMICALINNLRIEMLPL